MAHAIVEYTGNIAHEADIKGLLAKLADEMRKSDGVFPTGGIRVRAIRLDEYFIADGEEDYAFVNVTVKMGPGRDAEFKKRFFGGMFEIVKAHFDTLYAKRYLALSLYVEEADEAGSFKHNNIHAKFRSQPKS